MQVRYVGPVDAVEVVVGGGRRILCARDQVVDVPDDVGARLIAQDRWQAVEPVKAPAKARPEAPRDEEGAS